MGRHTKPLGFGRPNNLGSPNTNAHFVATRKKNVQTVFQRAGSLHEIVTYGRAVCPFSKIGCQFEKDMDRNARLDSRCTPASRSCAQAIGSYFDYETGWPFKILGVVLKAMDFACEQLQSLGICKEPGHETCL